jgi:hypothetical protein
MKMKIENRKQGWLSFLRFYCTEGWIDYCLIDQAHNPNNADKCNMNLNTSMAWFRLKGGEWYAFGRSSYSLTEEIKMFSDYKNSHQIWEQCFRPKIKFEPCSKCGGETTIGIALDDRVYVRKPYGWLVHVGPSAGNIIHCKKCKKCGASKRL